VLAEEQDFAFNADANRDFIRMPYWECERLVKPALASIAFQKNKMSFPARRTVRKELHMRKLPGTLLLVFALSLNLSHARQHPTVLIAYYSVDGHTKSMAEAVANGARGVSNVKVKVMTIDEVKKEDLLTADAIIVGTPVHNANAAPEVVKFMAGWPFEGAPLFNKIGAVFVTAGGISAGEELTQMNILHSMLLFGMVVVGGGDWTSAFGASAITSEKPFALSQKNVVVAEQFLRKAEGLGKRVAELAVHWGANPK
jgi:NAD(P)H dehydrogenase (quinone)